MKKVVEILIILYVNIPFLLADINDMSIRLCPSNNLHNCSKPYYPDVLKWKGFSNNNLLSTQDKPAKRELNLQQYRVDIGFNNNILLSSDILKKGYSGFGFLVEPYITKYFSFKFEFNYWIISSLYDDPHDTPFNTMHVWKKNYLVKINIYPWNKLIFTQFGIVRTDRKVGSENRDGLNFGVGYRLIDYKNVNVFLTAKRNIFGQPSVGGSEIWDIDSELSVDVLYKIKWESN